MDQSEVDIFLFSLYSNKVILADYDVKIRFLINSCVSDQEFELVCHVLKELSIFSPKQITFALKSMFSKILTAAAGRKVAVVATSLGEEPDSSQVIVQILKSFLTGQRNIVFFNGMVPFTKKSKDFEICYLVDEFSGTGKTIISRLKHIRNEAKQRQHNLEIEVYLVAAMDGAVSYIRGFGETISCEKTFPAGISGYYSEKDALVAIDTMKLLEGRLAAICDDAPLPSLGYGQAQALYGVENWNAPNSNFPILWWREDMEGNSRQVILNRGKP